MGQYHVGFEREDFWGGQKEGVGGVEFWTGVSRGENRRGNGRGGKGEGWGEEGKEDGRGRSKGAKSRRRSLPPPKPHQRFPTPKELKGQLDHAVEWVRWRRGRG